MTSKSILLTSLEDNFLCEKEPAETSGGQMLLALDKMQERLLPREERCWERALLLIRGRGWPSEAIRAFFLSELQISQLALLFEEISQNLNPRQPSAIGPTAVIVPRNYGRGLSETGLTTVILRQMIYARSLALPDRKPNQQWKKDINLCLLGQGVVEIITESILSPPSEVRFKNIDLAKKQAERLCRQADLSSDDIERLSIGEVFCALADRLGCAPADLASWTDKKGY